MWHPIHSFTLWQPQTPTAQAGAARCRSPALVESGRAVSRSQLPQVLPEPLTQPPNSAGRPLEGRETVWEALPEDVAAQPLFPSVGAGQLNLCTVL